MFDLEEPDAETATMPSAPSLAPTTDELAYEMVGVYELALLRDTPLTNFVANATAKKLQDTVTKLDALDYKPGISPGRPSIADKEGNIAAGNAFRWSSPQVDVGPYLSQFLLIGNDQSYGNGGVQTFYERHSGQIHPGFVQRANKQKHSFCFLTRSILAKY